MHTKDPIAPIIRADCFDIAIGQPVWLVGNLPFTQKPLPEIRPAPNNPWGWRDHVLFSLWVPRSLNPFRYCHALLGGRAFHGLRKFI